MTAVAAQVMAWQRRMHNRPGPLGVSPTAGSGEQPSGLPQVELYIGGWIDVTALGLVRYQQGIKVTRGQPDENQKTNPSTATFRLANVDGRFNPRNPTGPYWGLIDKNTPCRISVQSGNAKSYRFWGEISSWPQGQDSTGNDAWVDIQAAGILRRLGTGVNPLRSPIYLLWSNATGSNAAAAYWPMEDTAGSTQLASGIGGTPMSITGAPSLSANTAFVVSAALPTLNGASFTGRVPAYTRTPAQDLFQELYNDIECLLQIPSSGETTGTVIMSFTMNGALPLWEVYYSTASSGQVGLRGRNSAGTVVIDTGAVGANGNGLAGQLSVQVYQSGADTFCQVALFDPFGISIVQGQATLASTTCGIVTSVTVNPGGGLQSTAVGHLSVTGFLVFASGGQSAYNGYTGETAGVRFQRLCGVANVASELVYNPATSNTGPRMGPQHPGNLLDLLQECADADGGIIFETVDQLGLGYRCRDTIENQTSAVLALDYAQQHLSAAPIPIDDDQFTRNDVTVQRLNGTSYRAQQVVGPENVANPPVGVGRYSTSITMSLYSDAQTVDEAQWKVHLGTIAEPRYPDISVQLSRPEITSSPVLRQNALAVMPGDRITLANPPVWLPPGPVSALALGWSEQFDQFLHLIKWNTAPESGYRVAVCDDAFYGHADTDGSTLAAPALATDTVLQIATTNAASPLWTTNVADYPFDLALGGERVTAWACGQPLGSIDGTFESGVTGWTPTGCTLVAAPGFSHSGSQSGLMTVTGSPTQAFIRPDTSHNAPVAAGSTYQATMWVYSPIALANVMASIDWLTSGEVYISTSSGASTTLVAGLWTPLSVSATAVATSAFARGGPTVAGSPANGTQLWVDDYLIVAPSSFQSSPQTLAVLRSVNGVVKPQTVNTGVQLWQPAIATM
jgi:hypothetical protein